MTNEHIYEVRPRKDRRFVIECPATSTTFFCYEKLDHLHFGPLFSGDDAGFVQ